jgi:hypothetical protein
MHDWGIGELAPNTVAVNTASTPDILHPSITGDMSTRYVLSSQSSQHGAPPTPMPEEDGSATF